MSQEDFMEGVSVSSADSPQDQATRLTFDPPMFDEDMKISPADESLEGVPSSAIERELSKPSSHRKRHPGAGWDDKEAREDYDRAMKTILDRHFSMSKYGDPILDMMTAKNVKRY